MKDQVIVGAACGRNHTLLVSGRLIEYLLCDGGKIFIQLLDLAISFPVRGEVFAMGDNKNGQCGIKNSSQATVPTTTPVGVLPLWVCVYKSSLRIFLKQHFVFQINYKGAPIVKVGCGAEFSIILDCKGATHSFGLPEYGQLGKSS